MAKDKKPSEDQVGYGRPPIHKRWGKGQSGNPRGRPKGSKNFGTILQEELDSRVSITENGRQRKISKRALIAKQFAKKAAEGDLKDHDDAPRRSSSR